MTACMHVLPQTGWWKTVSMPVMYYPWTMQRSFWAIMMWIWYCRIFVSTTAMAWNCWNGWIHMAIVFLSSSWQATGTYPVQWKRLKKVSWTICPNLCRQKRYSVLSGKHWNVREGTAIQNKDSIQAKALWHWDCRSISGWWLRWIR